MGRDPKLEWDSSVPNVALSGDRFYRPMEVLGDYIPYTGSVMAIDPSGRGKDETGRHRQDAQWIPLRGRCRGSPRRI